MANRTNTLFENPHLNRIIQLVAIVILTLFGAKTIPADNYTEKIKHYLNLHPEILQENPELIEAAIILLKSRKEREANIQRLELVESKEEVLFDTDFTPVSGNLDAPITVIEFSDLQCVQCKKTSTYLNTLLSKNRDLRVVHKFLPLHGHNAILTSHGAMTAHRQNKYKEYQLAILRADKPLATNVEDTMRNLNIDISQTQLRVISAENRVHLEKTRNLAELLGISKIPAYLVGGKLIQGQFEILLLHDLIIEERFRQSNIGENYELTDHNGHTFKFDDIPRTSIEEMANKSYTYLETDEQRTVETARETEEITETDVVNYIDRHPEFLADNPELIQQSMEVARTQAEEREKNERQSLIRKHKSTILGASPQAGELDSPFTILTFFDYQCVPCKKSHPEIELFLEENKNAQMVYLQLPIYGALSTMAAKTAAIVHRHGDFFQYHNDLMKLNAPLDRNAIEKSASKAGVEINFLHKEIQKKWSSEYLEVIKQFAEDLGVIGTPTYFVNGKIIRGGINGQILKSAIDEMQQKRSAPRTN